MKALIFVIGLLFIGSAWAAGTVSISGKVKSLANGIVTIESSDLSTQIKVSEIPKNEQKIVRSELAKAGQVTVHVSPKSIVSQKKTRSAKK